MNNVDKFAVRCLIVVPVWRKSLPSEISEVDLTIERCDRVLRKVYEAYAVHHLLIAAVCIKSGESQG